MSEELTVVTQEYAVSANVFANLDTFKEIYDIGKMFASSSLVPQAYQ